MAARRDVAGLGWAGSTGLAGGGSPAVAATLIGSSAGAAGTGGAPASLRDFFRRRKNDEDFLVRVGCEGGASVRGRSASDAGAAVCVGVAGTGAGAGAGGGTGAALLLLLLVLGFAVLGPGLGLLLFVVVVGVGGVGLLLVSALIPPPKTLLKNPGFPVGFAGFIDAGAEGGLAKAGSGGRVDSGGWWLNC